MFYTVTFEEAIESLEKHLGGSFEEFAGCVSDQIDKAVIDVDVSCGSIRLVIRTCEPLFAVKDVGLVYSEHVTVKQIVSFQGAYFGTAKTIAGKTERYLIASAFVRFSYLLYVDVGRRVGLISDFWRQGRSEFKVRAVNAEYGTQEAVYIVYGLRRIVRSDIVDVSLNGYLIDIIQQQAFEVFRHVLEV